MTRLPGGKAVLYGEVKCQNEIHIRIDLKTRLPGGKAVLYAKMKYI